MKEKRVINLNKEEKGIAVTLSTLVLLMCFAVIINCMSLVKDFRLGNRNELRAARNYSVVSEGDNNTQSDNVKFDVYVLKDLDGDGRSEKIRGTCKAIGDNDTLYMELNMMGGGTLKDGKIEINGENFYLATGIGEDDIIKGNYISNNTKRINLKDIKDTTNTLITGNIQSGDYAYPNTRAQAIKVGNINNYSSNNNKIILTGTFVDENNVETLISKEVNLEVDWYGSINTELKNTTQVKQLDDKTSTLDFDIVLDETKKELMLSKMYVEGEIPQINGYDPVDVILPEGGSYDAQTRKFVIENNNEVDSDGKILKNIKSNNTLNVKVEYPTNAFLSDEDISTFVLKVPVKGYYEGYNNSKVVDEITKSNEVEEELLLSCEINSSIDREYGVDVQLTKNGTLITEGISKKNAIAAYGNDLEDEDKYEEYEATWYIVRRKQTQGSPIVIKSKYADSIDGDIRSSIENTGIKISGKIAELLGEDGYINVYNEDTNELIKQFTKDDWGKEYKYETEVRKIKIETSNAISAVNENDLGSIIITNYKRINNLGISREMTIEKLLSYNDIYTYCTFELDNNAEFMKKVPYKNYTSDINVSGNKLDFSSQVGSDFSISINTLNSVWKDGKFLVKFPEEVSKVDIKDIRTTNSEVEISKYRTYEENGNVFLEIQTKNEKPTSFYTTIETNIEFDPFTTTNTSKVEIYASNPNYEIYGLDTRKEDIYNLSQTFDYVAYSSLDINITAPNNLITTERIIDSEGNTLAKPSQQIELDKSQLGGTRKISVSLFNNYSLGKLEDVKIIGKVPFTGNKYQIADIDMGSEFDTYMTDSGISIPDDLKDKANVYYSENATVNNDLNDNSNGWTKTPQDFSKVKNYMIDLSNADIKLGQRDDFTYELKLPEDVPYNTATYSTHAVYFGLSTNEGILDQRIETNKLGIVVAKRLDLELTKYEELSNDKVSGAIYSIDDKNSKTIATTDENGKINFDGLYVEKEYILKEESENKDYELDTQSIRFTTYIEDNELKIKILDGTVRNSNAGITNDKAWATIDLDTRAKYTLNINKFEKNTSNLLSGVKFVLVREDGEVNLTTNINGNIVVNRLSQDHEYTLKEIDAPGYDKIDEIKFNVTRENGGYKLNITNGKVRSDSKVEKIAGKIPTLNLNIENEKLNSYTLELSKLETNKDTVIPNTKFNLKGKWLGENGIELTTNDNGKLRVELYEGFEYTLKETEAAEGYILNDSEIKFVATRDSDGNWNFRVLEGSFKSEAEIEGGKIKVVLENESIFTIIKKDEETGKLLKGVKFAIYQVNRNEDGTETLSDAYDVNNNVVGVEETINGITCRVLETDENGTITKALKPGLYKAVEVKALEGYDISNTDLYTYYFGIGETQKGSSAISLDFERDDMVERDIAKTNDGGYVGVHTGGITKYDSNFNVVWSTDTPDGYFYEVEQTNDGGYIALAEQILAKYSYNGSLEWSKTFSRSEAPTFSEVITTNDGNILVAMILNYVDNSISDYLTAPDQSMISIRKFDLNGNQIWKNDIISDTQYDQFHDISDVNLLEDSDENYIAYANCGNSSAGTIIYKYDRNGNEIWSTCIGRANSRDTLSDSSSFMALYDSCLANDGGYIFVGTADRFTQYGIYGRDPSNDDRAIGVIVKVDKNGKIVWMKENLDTNLFIGIDKLNDNSYVLQGEDSIYIYNRDFEQVADYTLSDSMFSQYKDSGNKYYVYNSQRNSWSRFAVLDNSKVLIAGKGVSQNKTSLLSISKEAQSIPERQKIIVYNSLKEYNIVTTAGENGSISGSDEEIYEKVKYGKDSTKDIVVTPNEGYLVEKILVNGEILSFTENQDNTVTLPKFTNVKEDKLVMATFVPKDKIGYVDVEYRELDTEKELLPTKEIRGVVGQNYTTSPELNIPGYSLVEDKLPQNINGIVTENRTKVVYYYQKQLVRIVTSHIDVETNEKIAEDVVDYKYVNEEYHTKPLENILDKYILNSNSNNTDGIVTGNEEGKEINVEYYYKTKEFNIKTRKATNGGTITGSDKDIYEIVKYGMNSTKKIVVTADEGYDIESITINGNQIGFTQDENRSVELEQFVDIKEDKEVVARFKRRNSAVIVKYVDKDTNETIADDEIIEGDIGTEYETSPKEIKGYVLVEEPLNKKGTIASGEEYVIYYYEKEIVNTPADIETPFTGTNIVIIISIISICLAVLLITTMLLKRGGMNDKKNRK